jgi:hypothetical protein
MFGSLHSKSSRLDYLGIFIDRGAIANLDAIAARSNCRAVQI